MAPRARVRYPCLCLLAKVDDDWQGARWAGPAGTAAGRQVSSLFPQFCFCFSILHMCFEFGFETNSILLLLKILWELDELFHRPTKCFRIIGAKNIIIGIYNSNANTYWINAETINAIEKCESSLVKVFILFHK